MGLMIKKMQALKLFYCPKREVYFYVTEGNMPLCDACKEEITANLVYHTIWTKKRDDIRTYHLGCHEKIQPRGLADEFKICVVVDKAPEDTLPVFERKPHLTSGKGDSVFDIHKILKGSEAKIIDRTRISKDPNQSRTIDFEKNLIEFQKRDELLGPSFFIAVDMVTDERNQNREDDSINNIIKGNDRKEKKRERVYKDDLPKDVDIHSFFKEIKESQILLPGQEPEEILSLKEPDNKKQLENKR